MLRQFVEDWAPTITGTLGGTLLGIFLAAYVGNVPIDSGFSQLVGSAIGAGLAAGAAIIAAQYQTSAPKRSYERFIADSALGVRDEADVLGRMCPLPGWASNAQCSTVLTAQINALKDPISLFQGNAPFNGTSNYGVRLRCAQLDRALKIEILRLENELKWLDTPTIFASYKSESSCFLSCDRKRSSSVRPKRCQLQNGPGGASR